MDAATLSSTDDCNGVNPPNGKNHMSDALLRESVDKGIVTAVWHVVEVLDTNDLRDFLSLLELPAGDVAETDVTNQSLTLQLAKHTQRFFDGSFRWFHDFANSKVDDVERVDTEISKIVMNASISSLRERA